MHHFLRKSLASLLILLVAGGILVSLLAYYVHRALHTEDRDHSARAIMMDLREQIASDRSLFAQRTQVLGWDPSLISFMDRDQGAKAAEYVRTQLASMQIYPDYIFSFDFDFEQMPSSVTEQKPLVQLVAEWLRSQHFNDPSNKLVVYNSKPYQLYSMPVGGLEKPAGYVALMFAWKPSQTYRYEHMKLETINIEWQNPPLGQAWSYQVSGDQITIKMPTWNEGGELVLQMKGFYQPVRHLDYSLILVPVLVMALLGGFGYTLIIFLYRQTFQPLDQLFLFIKMLRDRKRYQKRPDFIALPLFRRIANEVLEYLKEVELDKRTWKKSYHQLRRKADAAEDLAQLSEWEVQIWSRQSSMILQKAIYEVELVKTSEEPALINEFILSLAQQLKLLNQYQICFGMRAMVNGASKLQNRLRRMQLQETKVSFQQLCEIETSVFALIASFETYSQVRKQWQGLCSLSEEISDEIWRNLIQRPEIWSSIDLRLKAFTKDYAQVVGRIPPDFRFSFPEREDDQLWLMELMPQWIEGLAFLIENVIEDYPIREQSKKPASGRLDLKLTQHSGALHYELQADGKAIPIARDLPRLVPSESFHLDEADADEAWKIFNRMQLQAYLGSSGKVSVQLTALVHLIERASLQGFTIEVGPSTEGGLKLSCRKPLLPHWNVAY